MTAGHRLVPSPAAPEPPTGAVGAWRAMLEAHADVIERLAHAFRTEHDLSVTDFDVLINIGPHESVRHRDLAARVVLSRSALSRLVDRLIVRGFLTRQRATDDSRGVVITLTPDGRVARDQAKRTNDEVVTRMFAGFDPEEIAILARLATRLATQTNNADDRLPSPDHPRITTTQETAP